MEQLREKDPLARSFVSRRDALIWLGATGATWLMDRNAQSAPLLPHSLCIVRPEQTEGPYFVDERLHRSDIRTDPTENRITAGTPLTLTFQVMRLKAGDCQPLPDAQVDIWHCDARGIYSDVQDPGFDTMGQKFLRGYQMTDSHGIAEFLTIYPGWYPIRTVHIHFKIRTAPVARRSFEFTSQVYFPDDLTDHIHADRPYSSIGPRRVRNQHDFIFRQGGAQLMLDPVLTRDVYKATFPVALQLP